MFNDISCDKWRQWRKNVWKTLKLVSFVCMRNLVKDNGHSLVLVPKRSGILWKKTWSTRNLGSKLQKGCCWNLLRADVQFSVLQLHCPGGQLKSKGHGKLSIHFAADQETTETIFRIIVSANRLSLYGAVANMCEECESFPRSIKGNLIWWWDNQLF